MEVIVVVKHSDNGLRQTNPYLGSYVVDLVNQGVMFGEASALDLVPAVSD